MGRYVWTEMQVVARSGPSIDDEPVSAFTRTTLTRSRLLKGPGIGLACSGRR
jgi:hypothetical protein